LSRGAQRKKIRKGIGRQSARPQFVGEIDAGQSGTRTIGFAAKPLRNRRPAGAPVDQICQLFGRARGAVIVTVRVCGRTPRNGFNRRWA
jgi:hypothetical protein